MARVSPSEQPSGSESMAGGPPAPSGWRGDREMRSYCTPRGKSAAVSTTLSSLAPGQVAVPEIACAQAVSTAASRTANSAAPECRLVM